MECPGLEEDVKTFRTKSPLVLRTPKARVKRRHGKLEPWVTSTADWTEEDEKNAGGLKLIWVSLDIPLTL